MMSVQIMYAYSAEYAKYIVIFLRCVYNSISNEQCEMIDKLRASLASNCTLLIANCTLKRGCGFEDKACGK